MLSWIRTRSGTHVLSNSNTITGFIGVIAAVLVSRTPSRATGFLSYPIRTLDEMDIFDIIEPLEPGLSRRVKRAVATIACVAFVIFPGPANRWLTRQVTVHVQHQVDDFMARIAKAGLLPTASVPPVTASVSTTTPLPISVASGP